MARERAFRQGTLRSRFRTASQKSVSVILALADMSDETVADKVMQAVGRRVKSRRIPRLGSCYYSLVDEPGAQHVRARGYRSYARANHRHDPGNASCSLWTRRGPDRPRAYAAKRLRLGR